MPAPESKVTATVFTAISVLITISWQAFPKAISFLPLNLWVWSVCCGVVLLSASRFTLSHCVPLLEVWLLSFPFLFEVFFQKICPTTKVASVDELLWSFDANFGYPQPFLGRLLVSEPLFFWTCKVIWSSLPLLFVVLYLAVPECVRSKYLRVIVSLGCLILPLYALCPAAGPVYLFRGDYPYPDGLPMPLLHPQRKFLQAGLLLNTTPSGHVAWALLLFWFAYRYCRKRVTVFFGLILVITAVATLGLGEHYVIDLMLSIPYAAGIWSLGERQWKRSAVLLALVVVWLVALREGWAILMPAPAVWLLCVVTGLLSCWRFDLYRTVTLRPAAVLTPSYNPGRED
jgi:hypothetical protein